MNKIAHISVRDNRKSDFFEKPQAFAFLNIFTWNFQFSESMFNFIRKWLISRFFLIQAFKSLGPINPDLFEAHFNAL